MAWKQSRERNRRLKKLAAESDGITGAYFDEDKGRGIRIFLSDRAKPLRTVGNRKLRRLSKRYFIREDDRAFIPDHSGYRKLFDFWWELF